MRAAIPIHLPGHNHVLQWHSRLVRSFKDAPRSELEQALLRVVIPALVMLYIGIDAHIGDPLSDVEFGALWFAIVFFLFAIALMSFVLAGRGNVTARRLFGIFADNAGNTVYLLIAGEAGAFVTGIYLFVTFGNGFRYGRFYLRVSQGLSIAGFLVVLYASPFWLRQYPRWHRNIDRTSRSTLLCWRTC